MLKCFFVIMAFSFALTTSVSAGMLCCWDMPEDNAKLEQPCHSSDDTAGAETVSLNCCDDMALCEVPLVYGAIDLKLRSILPSAYSQPVFAMWGRVSDAVPPVPPPKLYL